MNTTLPDTYLYCFLDAMVLFHFQTFDEVDWPRVLQTRAVCLVLTPSVMRELNDKKDDSRDGWLQKRARMIVSKVKHILRTPAVDQLRDIRSETKLLVISREPSIAWQEQGLDPQIKDDRMLATMITFAQTYPDCSYCFASNDFLAGQKAESRGMRVVDPEGIIPLIERASAEESRSGGKASLSPKPNIEFGFWEATTRTNRVSRVRGAYASTWPSDQEITEHVAQKQHTHERLIANAQGHQDERAVQLFATDSKEYLGRLAMCLHAERSRKYGPRCHFAFVLENAGSTAAVDVSIILTFPEGSFVVDADKEDDDFYGDVWMPNEPKPSWREQHSALWGDGAWLALPSYSAAPVGPRGPFCLPEKQQHIVRYTHPKMRPGTKWHMDAVVAFLPPTMKGGFQVTYTMHADYLPAPIEQVLHVTFTTGS